MRFRIKNSTFKHLTYIIVGIVYFTFPAYSYGAYFKIEPEKQKLEKGEQFIVTVTIDTEGEKPKTVEAQILYDETKLRLVTTPSPPPEDERMYPVFLASKRNQTNKINVGGSINPNDDPKAGKGKIAILTFEGLDEGVHTVTFNCKEGDTTDSNINIKKNGRPTDIIECSKLNEGTFTIGDEPIGSQSPTPSPRLSMTPGLTPTGGLTPTITLITSPSPSIPLTTILPSKTPTPSEPVPGGLDTTLTIVGAGTILIIVSMLIKFLVL